MPDIAATRPVAGAPIETAWGQQVHDAIESVLGARALTTGLPASSFAVPYSTYTLIPGVQLTAVPVGWHLVIAKVDVDSTSSGFGFAITTLYVDGVQQLPGLVFGGPAGNRSSVTGIWLVNVTGAGTIELRTQKTINGGTAQIVASTAMIIVL